MTDSCERIQELILNALSGAATPAEERDIAGHVAQCAACREFQKAGEQDDRQLTAYADAVSRSVSGLPERVAAALEKRALETPRPIPLWRKIMRSRVSQLSAAAVLAAAILVILTSGGRTAWAQITEALQKAQRVHVVAIQTGTDGKTQRDEWWFEKPSHLREEHAGVVIVDNGVNKLDLDLIKKTAQLSDSLLPYNPIEKNENFKSIDILQQLKAGFPEASATLTPLPDEKDGAVQVYALEMASKDQKHSGKGKLWIAAKSKLPIRIAAEVHTEIEQPHDFTLEGTWNYEPIPAEVFSTAVPAGYTELPRKQRGTLSGRVLDEQGAPVSGAVVYATNVRVLTTIGCDVAGTCDANGNFELKLPPESARRTAFPIFVAAYRRDDADHVAWTLVTGPDEEAWRRYRALWPIPGSPGRCEILNGKGNPQYGNVTGIVLQMEPTGRIYGTVTDKDGKPVRGARINGDPWCEAIDSRGYLLLPMEIILPRGPSSTKTALATTDAMGHYELTNVPRFWNKVQISLRVGADGFVPTATSFRSDGGLLAKEVNFQVYEATITVTGRAMNDHGEPMAGYEVVPVLKGTSCMLGRTITTVETDGQFTLQGCPETPELRIRLKADFPPGSYMDQPTKDFYPPVEAGIKYEAGKTKYVVNLVAQTPPITLRVVLKDSAGLPVRYFPVQLRQLHQECINEHWSYTRLLKRTDADGVCILTGVPRTEGMTLYLGWNNNTRVVPLPALTPEQKAIAAGNAKFYAAEPQVNLAPDRNEQTIEVMLLTFEEREAQRVQRKP